MNPKLIATKEADFRKARVEHPAQQRAFTEVWEELEMARHEPGVTMLVGPTGVGKTNLIERIRKHAADQFLAEAEKDGRMPFLPVTAAPPLRDTFSFRNFFRSILLAADDPFVRRDRARPSLRMTGDDLEMAALNVLRNRRPMVFCVDEAQHMTYAVRERRMEEHMDLIKWLASESRIPILMVGTNELLKLPLLSDQLGRRTSHVVLNPYRYDAGVKVKPGQVREIDEFTAAVKFFRSKLPVSLGFELDAEHIEFLFVGSCGAIGILKPWFDRALHRCLSNNRSTLTRGDLEAKRHSPGKLKTIAKAISAGRLQQRVLNGSLDEVRAELGVVASNAESKQPATPRALKPGQRRLVRDAVGVEEDAA